MSNEWSSDAIDTPIAISHQEALLLRQNLKLQLEAETDPLFKEMNNLFEDLKKKQEPLNPEFAKILNDNILDLF